MIDIVSLTKEDVGRWVLYQDGSGKKEKGRIKSWNDKFIFVVYHCDSRWDEFENYTAAATDPADLRFTTKGEMV